MPGEDAGGPLSTARALADDLERFLQGDVVEATGVFQGIRRWTGREPEVVSRLGGLAIVSILTEFNHRVLSPEPTHTLHYNVQLTLLLGRFCACFQFLWRKGWSSGPGADALVDGRSCLPDPRPLDPQSRGKHAAGGLSPAHRGVRPLVPDQPGMVHHGGLDRGISFPSFSSAINWDSPFPTWVDRDLQYPNIYVAGLLITGFVVARQLKRHPGPGTLLREPGRGGEWGRVELPRATSSSSANPTCRFDIGPDLCQQVVDTREGARGPEASEEIKLDHAVVEVAAKVQEMGLDLADLLAESRVRADVAGRGPAAGNRAVLLSEQRRAA